MTHGNAVSLDLGAFDPRITATRLDAGGDVPIVLQPAVPDVDLAELCAAHRPELDALLARHGAILFRGFPLNAVTDFERAARAAAGDLFADYGDLPRNRAGENIYESTPYPPDQMILYHNESA